MNIYRTKFMKACPVNGDRILYALEIKSDNVIMSEAIELACDSLSEKVLHEEAADILAALGGCQTLTATHRGVEIETRRNGLR